MIIKDIVVNAFYFEIKMLGAGCLYKEMFYHTKFQIQLTESGMPPTEGKDKMLVLSRL